MTQISGIPRYLKNIFSYRELIFNLAAKDFKVRYKTAVLGFLWTLLNPLLMMLILSLVFSWIIKIDIEKYPVFLLAGLLPWYFFSFSLSSGTLSVVDNANLIKKIYFPREIILFSVVIANLINFLISLAILFIFMQAFKIHVTFLVLFLPGLIILECLFVLGISFIAATLHTFFRDTKYIIELMLLVGFYITPVFYPLSMVPEGVRSVYLANPMTCFIILYRDLLLYGKISSAAMIMYTIASSVIIFVFGLALFKKHQKIFADYV
ncbi:MAG: ABC transporter permease [Candidatus Omnitrophota bacterium]